MRNVYIILLIVIMILAPISFGSNLYSHDRNDAMCSAIYITAFKQTGEPIYRSRIKLFEWQKHDGNIHLRTYTNQVDFYLENLDTSTALLHWDRCRNRMFEIYADYKAFKQ